MRVPESGEAWGILGGAFDPPHLGHVSLATNICKLKRLDGILLIPSYHHPFKGRFTASYDDRTAMLKLAIKDRSELQLCEIEKEQDLPGYTLHTIRALKASWPQTTFYFLMGEDNLDELDRWHQPEKILDEVTILVGQRPPHKERHLTGRAGEKIVMITTAMVDVSSTEIRELLAQGGSAERLGNLLPEGVIDYIFERELYK